MGFQNKGLNRGLNMENYLFLHESITRLTNLDLFGIEQKTDLHYNYISIKMLQDNINVRPNK